MWKLVTGTSEILTSQFKSNAPYVFGMRSHQQAGTEASCGRIQRELIIRKKNCVITEHLYNFLCELRIFFLFLKLVNKATRLVR